MANIIIKVLNKIYYIEKAFIFKYLELTKNIRYKRALNKLKTKNRFVCVFFAAFDTSWKYNSLYQKMLSDPRFEPIIVICPIINYGRDNMIRRMKECELYFKRKGYKYVLSYDEKQDTYLDVKKSLNPDIIFYTNPYGSLVDKRYDIYAFLDKLSCYVPYFHAGPNDKMFYGLPFHKLVWRFYIENLQLKNEYSTCLNDPLNNYVSVGYASFDEFKSMKKTNLSERKKIIWAPHHLIEPLNGMLRDGFMTLFTSFFDLADYYCGQVEFIFRPHPLLKNKLYEKEGWGKEKTDKYYEKWNNYPNCSINEHGNYIQLFYDSDAMIHDCGSFTSEYLYVNKPVLFTDHRDFDSKHFFKVAQDAADCHYRGRTKEEIMKTLEEIKEKIKYHF